jgi:hypothetical protein
MDFKKALKERISEIQSAKRHYAELLANTYGEKLRAKTDDEVNEWLDEMCTQFDERAILNIIWDRQTDTENVLRQLERETASKN